MALSIAAWRNFLLQGRMKACISSQPWAKGKHWVKIRFCNGKGYVMNKSSLSVRIIVLALAAALCAAASAEAAWVNNHDGTVSDTLTGLMWQQGDNQND